jgi:hypothetical protein
LVDRLTVLRPHTTGESVTKFSGGELSRWVDVHAWFVAKDGTPTPIGADGGTALRIWSEVLVPTLVESIGETVAARIIGPGAAYLFDELDADEIARCEKAERALMVTTSTEEPF